MVPVGEREVELLETIGLALVRAGAVPVDFAFADEDEGVTVKFAELVGPTLTAEVRVIVLQTWEEAAEPVG